MFRVMFIEIGLKEQRRQILLGPSLKVRRGKSFLEVRPHRKEDFLLLQIQKGKSFNLTLGQGEDGLDHPPRGLFAEKLLFQQESVQFFFIDPKTFPGFHVDRVSFLIVRID